MCLQSSLAGGGGALRPEPTTPLTPAAAQPAPAAADRLPQRDSAAHRRVDRLLPQLQRADCGPRLSCYPRHPPLGGTTAEAFGFNKPLEIVKPGVWWRVETVLCLESGSKINSVQIKSSISPRSSASAECSCS